MSGACLSALDDSALVRSAKRGDHEAFEELWRRHVKLVLRTVGRITKNPEDAEDAMQDTFLNAYAHLGNFNGDAKFSTWLTRIAINSALMILRHRRLHPQTSLNVWEDEETWHPIDIQDQRVDIETSYVKLESALQLKSAIERLRPPLRNVMQIHQRNDGPLQETAELAGLTLAATKTRLLRARGALRGILHQQMKASLCRNALSSN